VVVLAACAGPEGPAGQPGTNGTDGRNGTDGSAFAKITLCEHVTSALLFDYELSTYTTGEVLAICAVTDAAASYATSVVWPDATIGATQGICRVGYDLDAVSGGYFEFRADGSRRATYHDAASPYDGTMVAFSSAECVTQ
jgi:hypothetical protein